MNSIKKHKWHLIVSLLLFSFFSIYYFGFHKKDPGQKEFSRLEQKYQSLEKQSQEDLGNFSSKKINLKSFFDQPKNELFERFIYHEDTLIYWSTNSISLPDTNNHKLTSGVHFLHNGWYHLEVLKKKEYTYVSSFLIQHQYPYENADLKNGFIDVYDFPYHAEISKTNQHEGQINSITGSPAFYVTPNKIKDQNPYFEFFAFLSLVIGFLISFYIFVTTIIESAPKSWLVVLVSAQIILIAAQILSLQFEWFTFLDGFEIFDKTLYGSGWIFPSLGNSIINICIIGFMAVSSHYLGKTRLLRSNKWFSIFVLPIYLIILGLALYITFSLKSFVIDSSIPFSIDQLFSLNFYSFIIIGLIFILFFSYFLLTRITIRIVVDQNYSLNSFYLFAFLTTAIYLVVYFYFGFDSIIGGVWPFVVNSVIYIVEKKLSSRYHFGVGVILLIVFAGYSSTCLTSYYEEKELNNRRSFARNLISDEDPVTEFEYEDLKPKLEQSDFLNSLLLNPYSIPKSEFDQTIESQVFNNHWNQYEISYFLFDTDSIPTINYRSAKGSDFSSLDEIIRKHTQASEISKGIYYVTDYYDKLSYVIKQRIQNKNKETTGYIFCLLKSKKIPEEIGFPSLLINHDDQVMTEIRNYSMARYVNGKLLRKYGHFNYPLEVSDWMKIKSKNEELDITDEQIFLDENDHFVLTQNQGNVIVLTKAKTTTLGFITTFSYLFALFGLLLLIPIAVANFNNKQELQGLSLTAKIQFVLLFFILVALLSFGFGSGTFIKKQYLSNSKDLIREKIGSVQTEVRQKLGNEETLNNPDLESYLEYILNKFSKVFVTDINLYSTDGDLLASSRSKIYNIGLISKKINTQAFSKMNLEQKSEFIHQENIGELTYLSAYQPFRNKDGKILAYLNLQYFAQQNALENQISEFLVSIINVFILLLATSIVLAIFITSWLTRPLKLIQKNISSVQLGQTNKPIDYSGNDEIGSLVEAYNSKVAELEENANQLAKSERESAWREMAKQVAHEIKNPLTPMKLSMQHFERSFDPNDPDAKERLEKLSHSIIEQIDGLTKIANEFSNFAKMPRAKEEELDLNEVIDICVELFEQSKDCTISWSRPSQKSTVLADKDLLIRVFNNLLKNGVQAIPKDRKGSIEIELISLNDEFIVSIKDNGIGIPKDKHDKIYVPNFTTKSTGTGLGLAMVKQIIEQAKGRVHFNSIENIGSTFYVTLPQISKED